MLSVRGLEATYGDGVVLRDIALEAKRGRVTCLVGRNGAGKTSLMRAIMGLIATPAGEILLDGGNIAGLPSHGRARSGIGYVPQGREIFPKLTVRENLLMGLEAAGGKGRIPEWIFETFPILKEFLGRKGGDLSGGQQQQLAIARAVVAGPKVLLLDEPTEGIQPSIIQEIGRVIRQLKDDMAVLMVEQYLEFVMEVCDYCYVIENGRLTMEGAPDTLDQAALQATMSL